MSHMSFEDRVRQFATRGSADVARWEERKVWWQGKVTELLQQIDVWLAPLRDGNTIEVTRFNVIRNEETLGSYTTEEMHIEIQGLRLIIRPLASVIVGGFGRVDMEGPAGSVMLILTNETDDLPPEQRRSQAQWFVSNPKRRRDLIPLSKDVFEDLFTDLLGIRE